jgi:hypothetical protein
MDWGIKIRIIYDYPAYNPIYFYYPGMEQSDSDREKSCDPFLVRTRLPEDPSG